jgi:hypothetical protein
MNSTTADLSESSPRSISSRNFLATLNNELSGQGWNLRAAEYVCGQRDVRVCGGGDDRSLVSGEC